MKSADSKVMLRRKFHEIRRRIPAAYRDAAARSAVTIFTHQDSFKSSKHIACYLPFNDEFETSPLIAAIWQAEKYCYLPVLAPDSKLLRFARYVSGDRLRLNRYSILEPAGTACVISATQLDLVIAPLLAFDDKGHRLGTGGGYYDYTFAFLRTTAAKKLQMLGLGYAAQQADSLLPDPWDVALDGIITERAFIQV